MRRKGHLNIAMGGSPTQSVLRLEQKGQFMSYLPTAVEFRPAILCTTVLLIDVDISFDVPD